MGSFPQTALMLKARHHEHDCVHGLRVHKLCLLSELSAKLEASILGDPELLDYRCNRGHNRDRIYMHFRVADVGVVWEVDTSPHAC
jgi:hypothetical protein